MVQVWPGLWGGGGLGAGVAWALRGGGLGAGVDWALRGGGLGAGVDWALKGGGGTWCRCGLGFEGGGGDLVQVWPGLWGGGDLVQVWPGL